MLMGEKAFNLFCGRHNVKLQKEYPCLKRTEVNVDVDDFNPNKNYILEKKEGNNISFASPFHFITLIQESTKIENVSTLSQIVNLLHVINWACFFQKKLIEEYSAISKEQSKNLLTEEENFSKSLADIITTINPDINITPTDIQADSKKRLSKNGAILKPSKFMQICRFYARAWFEENFEVEGSIKFAYYVSCYIESSVIMDYQLKHKPYRQNSHSKQEVDKLFGDETIVNYTKYNFSIQLKKHYNDNQLSYYTISISQLRCQHTFYKYARLHLERKHSIF